MVQPSDFLLDSILSEIFVAMKGLNYHAQITTLSCIFLHLPVITMSKRFLMMTALSPLEMCKRPHAQYKVFSLLISQTPKKISSLLTFSRGKF
ncbi:hypothetical protein Patl1_22483 [Pistacia atlantica]|uniref:Uncharacterized protein n=1 Tax=Pistacia atlantica TaxID=434234 RepID=A0ACC0ZZL1_9ROSI|nr:hypothetical protein Patl1_22483 [Pistacia atlantica]